MALSLNTLKAPVGVSNKKRIRRGRGDGSGYGSYSGRGTKGQTSRSGSRSGSGRMARKGMRKRLMSMPKLGGFTSLYEKTESVNLAELERHFDAGATVNPSALLKKGLIRTPRYGVKVLGSGATKKKFTIVGCTVSASARQKIEAAGGSVK
jgi:large subunit ribosomal protein L15